jgi:hypothetical protein
MLTLRDQAFPRIFGFLSLSGRSKGDHEERYARWK